MNFAFSNSDISDLIGALIYIIGMLVQFAYYTFAAEGIVFEVSVAIIT